MKDILPGEEGSTPWALTDVGGTLYFWADDGAHGYELWRSDGTEVGTRMVKDIWPGPDPSVSRFPWPIDVGGVLYFFADDGTHGGELWRSDGTEAGTVMVKDIRRGARGSILDGRMTRVSVVGTLYFFATDGAHGVELWRSDGTETGTMMVKDIRSGARGSAPSYLIGFADLRGILYLSADDGTHGAELWRSDGTNAGTVMVKDIEPGEWGSTPHYFFPVGGRLYMLSTAGPASAPGKYRLWTSDGTEAGTRFVKGFPSYAWGVDYPGLGGFTDLGDTLYFSAYDGVSGWDLWRTDGTGPGTMMVKDIHPGEASGLGLGTVVGDTLYMVVSGNELWSSDGTGPGTVMVKDIPGQTSDDPYTPGYFGPSSLTDVGGILYFSARDNTAHGVELWTSDGTEAGTVMVEDLVPGRKGSWPGAITDVGGEAFFSARTPAMGWELWMLTPG